jgi:hypothetical protein
MPTPPASPPPPRRFKSAKVEYSTLPGNCSDVRGWAAEHRADPEVYATAVLGAHRRPLSERVQPDDVPAYLDRLTPELRDRSQPNTRARLCKLTMEALRVTRVRGHAGYVSEKIVISNDGFKAVAN